MPQDSLGFYKQPFGILIPDEQPMLGVLLREYVLENTGGVEKASQALSPWQRRAAVATVYILLRPVVASGYTATEDGLQTPV